MRADSRHDEDEDVQVAILHELQAIHALLERQACGRSSEDPRHAQLLEALADTMEGFDLEFTTAEVLERRETDFTLDGALQAVRVTDTADLGALFRTLRDREVAGLRLVRDGRAWRLVRT